MLLGGQVEAIVRLWMILNGWQEPACGGGGGGGGSSNHACEVLGPPAPRPPCAITTVSWALELAVRAGSYPGAPWSRRCTPSGPGFAVTRHGEMVYRSWQSLPKCHRQSAVWKTLAAGGKYWARLSRVSAAPEDEGKAGAWRGPTWESMHRLRAGPPDGPPSVPSP